MQQANLFSTKYYNEHFPNLLKINTALANTEGINFPLRLFLGKSTIGLVKGIRTAFSTWPLNTQS